MFSHGFLFIFSFIFNSSALKSFSAICWWVFFLFENIVPGLLNATRSARLQPMINAYSTARNRTSNNPKPSMMCIVLFVINQPQTLVAMSSIERSLHCLYSFIIPEYIYIEHTRAHTKSKKKSMHQRDILPRDCQHPYISPPLLLTAAGNSST